jgi:predicted AAA+ superfamily ATPase
MTTTVMNRWIVGRQSSAKVLADRLMYSQGDAFLITGFRGVGKTTSVHYALGLIHGDFEFLDVWINLSRPPA